MRFTSVLRATIAIAAIAGGIPLGAQQPVPARADPWAPFLGCWSTSSSGVVGPMVCVVPGDSAHRVEFMTVSGDSVVGRTVIDASGTARPQVRGNCLGWEGASWSHDQRRLYIHADYRCTNGTKQRADAIIAMTHADAFTQVEGTLFRDSTPTRVVNYIVQLDTTAFPTEVRRRLGSYRALTQLSTDLETMVTVSPSEVMDAAMNVEPAVVDAWLNDRGERPELSVPELRTLRRASAAAVPFRPLIVPNPRGRSFSALGYQVIPYALQRIDDYRGDPYPTNIVVTPAMVSFGGSASGFPSDRSFPFRWP